MSIEPEWITVEDLIAFNREIVASTNPPEPHQIVIEGAIEAAQASPINLFHYGREEDVVVLAAHLCVAVSRAHAFLQGNKRTAFQAMRTFLRINGFDIVVPDIRPFSQIMIDLLKSDSRFEQFVSIIDGHLVDVDPNDLNQAFDEQFGHNVMPVAPPFRDDDR